MTQINLSSSREIVSVNDPRFPTRFRTAKARLVASAILSGASDKEAGEKAGTYSFYAWSIRRALRGVCRVNGCETTHTSTDWMCDRHHEERRNRRSVRTGSTEQVFRMVEGGDAAASRREEIRRSQVKAAHAGRAVRESSSPSRTVRSQDAMIGSSRRMAALRAARSGKLRF